jgi:hypothetical protein
MLSRGPYRLAERHFEERPRRLEELLGRLDLARAPLLRERGGAPRNPAPRNHFWGWIVKPRAATVQMGT